MQKRKWLAGVLATVLAAGVLAGCGGKPTEAPKTDDKPAEAPKKQAIEITVWTKFQNEMEAVKKASDEWAQKTGNKVNVIYFEQGFQEFLPIAAAGKGPDVYFGLPHDNLGTFQKAGLLDAVPPGTLNASDYPKVAVDAVSYDGKMFAVPVTVEAVALIYNKKLVPEAPKTWDDFLKVAKEKGFAYDARSFYFTYGFIGGHGGFVFESKGGSLDAKSVGLANDGGKAGLQLVADLVFKHNLFPADVNYDYMQGRFEGGKLGMMLNGPWGIDGAKKANIDVAVAPMPTLPNGKPFNPFVGVYAGFVASASQKKEASWDYLKFMLDNAPLKMYAVGKRLPAKTAFQQSAEVKADAIGQGFIASVVNGTPMPNIPAISAVWDPTGSMISLVFDKKADVAQATTAAVKAINEGVAALK